VERAVASILHTCPPASPGPVFAEGSPLVPAPVMMVALHTRLVPTLWLVAAATGCASSTPSAVPGGMAPASAALVDPSGDPGAEDSRGAGDQGQGLSADALFIRNMIPHHAQALVMSALVPGRAEDRSVEVLARRIETAQRDEIARMIRWLDMRGVPHAFDVDSLSVATDPDRVSPDAGHVTHTGQDQPAGHAGHADLPDTRQAPAGDTRGGPGAGTMHGMLSREEMQELETLSGHAFDRRFLELMIRHHQGAVAMVAELFASPGAAQDPEIFEIASEIDGGQRVEIERMRQMLANIR